MDSQPRSMLFVPGDRPERFDKAVASGADAVILDLEDSVAADLKDFARASVRSWLQAGQAWVRINPPGSDFHEVDLAALASCPGVVGVVVPKAEDPADLDRIADLLSDIPHIALVESARGLLAATTLANHPAVRQLAFGNLDFAADCQMTVSTPDELELLGARTHLVVACRAAGLPGPIDGVTSNVTDPSAAETDARRGADLGFSGKLCVHPSQVAAVHRAFSPTAEQVAWARHILGSVSEGVAAVDGQMIDRPALLRARRILSRAT